MATQNNNVTNAKKTPVRNGTKELSAGAEFDHGHKQYPLTEVKGQEGEDCDSAGGVEEALPSAGSSKYTHVHVYVTLV